MGPLRRPRSIIIDKTAADHCGFGVGPTVLKDTGLSEVAAKLNALVHSALGLWIENRGMNRGPDPCGIWFGSNSTASKSASK